MIVLGLHGGVTLGQHEPSAALVINGKVVAFCEEERYLRIKSCYGYLPNYSIRACLKQANIKWQDIDLIVTPGISYDDFDDRMRRYLTHHFGSCPKIERIHHQMAHLSAAFYGSGYEESLVLSLDATGDGACSMMGIGSRSQGIKILREIPTNESIGFFYTLMTYYLGFEDGDEYKVMGLAPYGKPNIDLSKIIRPNKQGWEFNWSLVRQKPVLRSPFEPTYADTISSILGQRARLPKEELSDFYKNVARSTQAVFEDCLMSLVQDLKSLASNSATATTSNTSTPGTSASNAATPVSSASASNSALRNLCFAGGVALNCSANKKLLYSADFDNVYVSPVASDRGLALGCAYHGAVMLGDKPWPMAHPYLGSSYSNDTIINELKANGIAFREVDDPCKEGASLLAQNKILGWFQGRSEGGARALGNRSILANCATIDMRNKVNVKIKYREEFRPFAPAVLFEQSQKYFDTRARDLSSMSFTVDALPNTSQNIQAVVHVDNTARAQTVRSSDNELFYELIRQYHHQSGTPVILNTSFNLKGQPIVESPRDAIMTFFGCGLDALIMGNFVVEKAA